MAKKDVDILFEKLDKLNLQGSWLSENTLSNVSEWFDTGCYALNAILGGTCRGGGVPKGRLTGFTGESSAGKSFFLNKIYVEGQKKDRIVVIFDSETAIDAQSIKNLGGDPSKVKWYPVVSVEDCRNQVVTLLQAIRDNPSYHGKVIIGIDSFGNLCSAKELADIGNNKDATDMGTRAKAIKSCLRAISAYAGITGTTVVFSNHVYEDPSQLHKSTIKTQGGGKGPFYVSSILVQLTKSNTRFDEKDKQSSDNVVLPNAKAFNSAVLNAFTVKNRFIPPFLEVDLTLNYKTGLEKYSGLLDMAVGYGLITKDGHRYTHKDGTKLGFRSEVEANSKFWEEKAIDELDAILKTQLTYTVIEDIDEDINEVEKEEVIEYVLDEKIKKKAKKVVEEVLTETT